MDITITTASASGMLSIPINLVFYAFVAAYVVHIIDESMLGENFVEMVRRSFWPAYEWKHFFGFNTLLMSMIILSVFLFDLFGGNWLLIPLIFVFQMVTNGLWHLGATCITKRYSPGLLTSILYWMLFHLIIRYAFLKGQIPVGLFALAGILGTLITIAMIGSFFVFRRRFGLDSQPEERA